VTSRRLAITRAGGGGLVPVYCVKVKSGPLVKAVYEQELKNDSRV